MGTLFISRIARYSNHHHALASAEHIIRVKMASQCRLTKCSFPVYQPPKNINKLLLIEARLARQYWKQYAKLLPTWAQFPGRMQHGDNSDVTNTLLDIGYHYLNKKVSNMLKRRDISAAVGLFHVAKTDKSTPLVYDLMELFRVDVVDREVLHYCRLKKKPIIMLTPQEISYFLSRIKRRLGRRVYLTSFHQCHSYEYAMELQILHFIHAVNHLEIFHPIHIPTRHDGRCAVRKSEKLDTHQK